MARLIIRVQPNDHPTDPTLTNLRTRLGDVVEAKEDGHVFSLCERTNGQYRIIDVPGAKASQFQNLLDSVFDVEGAMIARRSLTLSFTALSSGPLANLTTATKTQIDSITIART